MDQTVDVPSEGISEVDEPAQHDDPQADVNVEDAPEGLDNPTELKNGESSQDEDMAEVEVRVAQLEEMEQDPTETAPAKDDSVPPDEPSVAPETPIQDEAPAAPEPAYQHVELHIVDSDEEAAELRIKLLASPDQNVHLLACARELHVTGIVPTQMDAMAGSTPLFTYVLSTDFMGAAQEIARSLVSGVESAQQQHDAEMKRTRGAAKASPTKQNKGLDIYDFEDDGKAKPVAKKRKRGAAKRAAKTDAIEADGEAGAAASPAGQEGAASGDGEPKRGKKGSTPIKCLYCTYSTGKKYLLIRHMRCHSDERPHLCTQPGCTRAFKTTSSLQNHINTHGGVKPHACKFAGCTASFTTSGELVRHSRYRHTHEKPHKCNHEGCGYSSVEMSKLRRHLRSHTGERPFKCSHCDYASPDTYKLKRHLRVHTGEKPYECDICHHKFTQSNSMKAHRMIHDTVKPIFQCQLCPTKCSRKTDLKIHVQKLHQSDQPVVCKKCSKSFADRYLFNVHRKTDAECSTRKNGSARKSAPKRRKRKHSSEDSETTASSADLVSEGGSGQEAGPEEAQPEMEGAFHSVRCVLPGGDVVHILHNGNIGESLGTTHVVALTEAQMAELQQTPQLAVGEDPSTSAAVFNNGELPQGLRCSLLNVGEDAGDANAIQDVDFTKILHEVGIKAPETALAAETTAPTETEPEPMTVEA